VHKVVAKFHFMTGFQASGYRDGLTSHHTVMLTLILLYQPETTAIFGSIHRLCHSNYDLSTPTFIRSSDFGYNGPGFSDLVTYEGTIGDPLTLTLTLILLHQPETTASFGSPAFCFPRAPFDQKQFECNQQFECNAHAHAHALTPTQSFKRNHTQSLSRCPIAQSVQGVSGLTYESSVSVTQ
jgi:hypothetical protein